MTTKYQSDGEATRAIEGALRKAFPTAKISITQPQLIIEDELLANCIEPGLLKPDDKPIAIQARLKPAPLKLEAAQ